MEKEISTVNKLACQIIEILKGETYFVAEESLRLVTMLMKHESKIS